MAKINISAMDVESLLELRSRIDAKLGEHKQSLQKQLEKLGKAFNLGAGQRCDSDVIDCFLDRRSDNCPRVLDVSIDYFEAGFTASGGKLEHRIFITIPELGYQNPELSPGHEPILSNWQVNWQIILEASAHRVHVGLRV